MRWNPGLTSPTRPTDVLLTSRIGWRPTIQSADDWTKEGGLRLIELPIFADLSMESKDPYGGTWTSGRLFRTDGAGAAC
jgi:hypothetical protein